MTSVNKRDLRQGYISRDVVVGPAWVPGPGLYSTGNFLLAGIAAIVIWFLYKKGK